MVPEDPPPDRSLPDEQEPGESGYGLEDAVDARQLLIEQQVELCHEGILKNVGSINVGAIV